MSQVDNLLDNMSEEEIINQTTGETVEEHIIIDKDRFIYVPESLRKIAVQFDHKAKTVTFDCPVEFNQINMSDKIVYINYMRADGTLGNYMADNVMVDDTNPEIMHFDWEITDQVTAASGTLSFLVCVTDVDIKTAIPTFHWNSELNNEMRISKGLEVKETILQQYPDVITQLLNRMTEFETNASEVIRTAEEAALRAEEDAASASAILAEINTIVRTYMQQAIDAKEAAQAAQGAAEAAQAEATAAKEYAGSVLGEAQRANDRIDLLGIENGIQNDSYSASFQSRISGSKAWGYQSTALGDYTEAIADDSFTHGAFTKAGSKGFTIVNVDISDKAFDIYTDDQEWNDDSQYWVLPGLEVGDTYSMTLLNENYELVNFENVGKVVSMNGYYQSNTVRVYVDTMPDNMFVPVIEDTAEIYYAPHYFIVFEDASYSYRAVDLGTNTFRIPAKPSVGTRTMGVGAVATGYKTEARSIGSVAHGFETKAIGRNSHATGEDTKAIGVDSHAEGYASIASGNYAHAEGRDTTAEGTYSHAEGISATASGYASHAEGDYTTASDAASHAEGQGTTASGPSSHAEGRDTIASGHSSHAEGQETTAEQPGAHAEGTMTHATATSSHSEGHSTIASGLNSHAEGTQTVASGSNSHAEGGSNTEAKGESSHAEGRGTQAVGLASHSEGWETIAGGDHSHAEGESAQAIGENSHAEGHGTIARSDNQHVQGTYNVEDTTGKYLHIVGNGDAIDNRSNAHTLDNEGNAWFAGDVYIGGSDQDSSEATSIKSTIKKLSDKIIMYVAVTATDYEAREYTFYFQMVSADSFYGDQVSDASIMEYIRYNLPYDFPIPATVRVNGNSNTYWYSGAVLYDSATDKVRMSCFIGNGATNTIEFDVDGTADVVVETQRLPLIGDQSWENT
jgi:hypothetical protein